MHLKMIVPACKQGDPVDQTPPQTENTNIKKLIWIIQEEMCRGVKKYLESDISETKETLCFLTKATNIEDKLKRGDKTFAEWCLEKYPNLATKSRGSMNYQNTV